MALTKVDNDMLINLTKSDVGLGNVDNTADADKPVPSSVTAALALKAPLASPTFTGTVSGVTKSMVGLGNVDNTADTAKPVSTAQQTALDLKANLASPALTGTPTAPTASGATNTTQIATTAMVQAAVALVTGGSVTGPGTSTNNGVVGWNGTGGTVLKELTGAQVRDWIDLDTSDSPQFTAINLGHATDTTIARVSAGVISVEGSNVLLASGIGSLVQAYDVDLTTWGAKTAPSGAVVGDTDTQILSAKTLTAPVINTPTLNNAITVESYAANSSTNLAVDLANGTSQVITLTGNWVPSSGWPTATAGQGFRLILKTGAGSFTITWPSSVKWAAGTAPTITSAASKADIIDFESDGTNWYGYVVGQAYVP